MDAVILRGPFNITIERRPKPVIENPTDAIVKVALAGICGRSVRCSYDPICTPTYLRILSYSGIIASYICIVDIRRLQLAI